MSAAAGVVPALGAFGGAYFYLRRRFSREVPIIMYHRIADIPGDNQSIPPEMFAKQMAYLQAKGFHSITADALYNHLTARTMVPARPILLTFDDGYTDSVENALPILVKYGMKGILFVVTGKLGQVYDWDDSPRRPHCRVMDEEQLKAWYAAGMDVGSHTRSHPYLDKLTEEQIREELVESKRSLEGLLGVPVDYLCYPYGDFDSRVQRIAREAGYKAALAVFRGTTVWKDELYALPRVSISPRRSLGEFKRRVSWLHMVNLGLHELRHWQDRRRRMSD